LQEPLSKQNRVAGYRWFKPIILTTQEAEIRKITVQSHPQAISLGDPISKNTRPKKNPKISRAK
jgi:hypothetical protein